jgi:hypothetical protein
VILDRHGVVREGGEPAEGRGAHPPPGGCYPVAGSPCATRLKSGPGAGR